VAILPDRKAAAVETMEICEIRFIGIGYIQLVDGRMYASTDGRCLGSSHGGFAVEVHDGHRSAVNLRLRNLAE
jgi:hypothetical protein